MTRTKFTRRKLLSMAGAGAAALCAPSIALGAPARIVVIGGGFGGAAAARAAKVRMPSAEIVLLTDQQTFWMCPGSNAVLAGLRTLDSIAVGYDAIRAQGIDVRLDPADAIDADARTVVTRSGSRLRYDKLIMSPGIAFNYDSIDGLSLDTVEQVPHAWKAGPQTELLAAQLRAMPEDGLFVLTMPRAPYRCPPAPAERACLVAHYLQRHKPGARLLILDAKDEFPFQDLFTEAWETLYGDIIEYRSVSQDGVVREVDPVGLSVFTDFDEIKADVINVIPPQIAGPIANAAGATDETGWCPVDIRTFASTVLPDVHVVGDAALTDALPKAGSTAASQAHVAVDASVAALEGREPPSPSWFANCYSLASPDYGVRLGATFAYEDGHVVRTSTDFSELGADDVTRDDDARFAEVWLEQVKREVWG